MADLKKMVKSLKNGGRFEGKMEKFEKIDGNSQKLWEIWGKEGKILKKLLEIHKNCGKLWKNV